MKTLYLCGAGNPEGVRLALTINNVQKRWDRIVILDDDSKKHGRSIMDIEIAGPFTLLGEANPDIDEVSNMVARTTKARLSALRKIKEYGLRLATLINPDIDMLGVEFTEEITVYPAAQVCAGSTIGSGSVALMRSLVGHGSHVGRGCVVAPGAIINARVLLCDGVYVGTNASILPDLRVGPWATIGANSAVVQDVPAGATVMGVPAQILMQSDLEASDLSAQATADSQTDSNQSGNQKIDQADPFEPANGSIQKLRLAQHRFIAKQQSNS